MHGSKVLYAISNCPNSMFRMSWSMTVRPVILPSVGPFTFGMPRTSTWISTRPEWPPVSLLVS
jgi:hypothetical protein